MKTNNLSRATRADMIDGEQYDLGACVGTYIREGDFFNVGNARVYRNETIYGDQADPLYLCDIRWEQIEAANCRTQERITDAWVEAEENAIRENAAQEAEANGRYADAEAIRG